MAISNKERRLVLTTGNKSELAVGYCTLYGDMVGGLAVIADLYKTEVYTLARWLNRDDEVIPQATIDKPPSAELAPDQKDEDSLPPYPVLDEILSRYLEERADRAAIVARGHDPALVDRVIGMIRRAEYKRWQAAPGLRVSSKAFGSGRRIPLAKRWTEPK
jgi:NAD+ synthetase